MWIFTTTGFYSVTTSPVEAGMLQIRARERGDLESLCAVYGISARIVETPQADYQFRVLITPEEFGTLMLMIANSIDYPNFKKAVGENPEQEHKGNYYMRVWAVMKGLEMRGEPHSSWQEPDDVPPIRRPKDSLPLFAGHIDYPAIEGDDKGVVPMPKVILKNVEQRGPTPERRKKLIKTATYRRGGKAAK